MSNNMFTNPVAVKAGSAFAIAFAIDNLYFQNKDLQQNAMFAGAASAGIVVGSMIGDKVPAFLPDSAGLYQGKLVTQRILELSTGIASGYAINKFVLGNDYDSSMWMQKIATIGIVDFGAEYLTDYITGSALGYLTV
jgi:hypothetical protein